MRQIFLDSERQKRFVEQGYVLEEFLDPEAVQKLRELWMETAGRDYETYDFAKQLSYYISIFDRSPEHRRAANAGIRPLLERQVEGLLVDYRILTCNFMVKAPKGGEIEAHQDFTWVDEREHIAFNLWIPLEDTDDRNGCFHLIPGSHRMIRSSYRSATSPDTLTSLNESLKPFMRPIHVRAGSGILFDHRLFHYSPDNLSDSPRLAAQLVLVPREAQPVVAHFVGSDSSSVQLLAIEDENALIERNIWEDLGDLPVHTTCPYERLPEPDEILRRVRAARERD